MNTLTLAISGSGGAGAISTGEMILHTAARSGYCGMLKKTFSPQIRGGEAAAILRLGSRADTTFTDTIDVLVALDWQNFSRFADEVPITDDTLIVQNADAGAPPAELEYRSDIITIDGTRCARQADSDWVNMVFFGILTSALECPFEEAENALHKRLVKYQDSVQQAASRALRAGFELPTPANLKDKFAPLAVQRCGPAADQWLASGNQLAALGALEAGVRLVAAYPITPASDLLEFLAQHIEPMGGHLIQAEDELAAINMAIGGGFGGVPALTATSGPGLALMSEAMGLAVASETAVVVIDVMRGGPSTGIPTKSEQSDFNLAVYGLHGDAPHLVVACNGIADCYTTTAWAVALASELQTLAIVLSDQFLGQSLQILPPLQTTPHRAQAQRIVDAAAPDTPYWRYRDTESGISPVAFPGDSGDAFTADGLEHTQNAIPSPKAAEHQRQLNKRQRKLESHDFSKLWAELNGDPAGKPLVICWGSVTGAALEARDTLADRGQDIAVLSIRLLAPLQTQLLEPLLARAATVLVAEQNHSAQFAHYLRSLLPDYPAASLAKPGPTLINATDIIRALEAAHGS